ncbi:MAG: radical SAM protein [Deltaproteobacteria bacterium]
MFLEIHPTDRCNLGCVFCNQSCYRGAAAEFDCDDLLRILAELADRGLRVTRFSGGGEPTIYPGICDILRFLRDRNIVVSVFTTNGLCLTKELVLLLKQANIQMLHVSLQAPTPDSWQYVTGMPGELFLRVVENIRMACALLGPRVLVTLAMHEQTVSVLEDGVSLSNALGAWVSIHDLNHYDYDQVFLRDLPSVEQRLRRLKRTSNRLSYGFYNIPSLKPLSDCAPKWRSRRLGGPLPPDQVCLAPWYAALLRPDGNVHVCCALSAEAMSLGNIHVQSFADIWSGIQAKAMREEAKIVFLGRNSVSSEIPSVFSKQCCTYCPVQGRLFANQEVGRKLLAGEHF